jgi:hypothetical protein
MALEEITAPNASEFLSDTAKDETAVESRSLDLNGIEDPLDLFNGLNINAIEQDDKLINTVQSNDNPEVVTNEDGPGKPKKSKEQLKAEARDIFRKGLIKDNVLAGNMGAVAAASRAPLQAAKAYRFDKFKSNVERYEAYGKETFNELGFNPLVDNEEYYNQNTGRWQEWKRMFGQFGNLFGTAFSSNYRSFSNSVKNQNVLDLDEDGNEVFSEANRLGGSTKGGFTGFATNLVLNSAYSVGIAANVVFEEAVIWGAGLLLAPETGGASLAVSAAAQTAEGASIAGKINTLRKGVSAAVGGTELGTAAKSTYQLLKGLSKAEDAKDFYQIAKGLGKNTLNFVNPFNYEFKPSNDDCEWPNFYESARKKHSDLRVVISPMCPY